MPDKSIFISIPADGEGYIGMRCPHCEGDFKCLASDLQQCDGTELFCARCGLSHDAGLFVLQPDVADVARRHAENAAFDLMNDFTAQLEQTFRSSKSIKMKTTRVPRTSVPELRAVTDLAEAEIPCCESTVKLALDQAATLFYCPFCGQAQD